MTRQHDIVRRDADRGRNLHRVAPRRQAHIGDLRHAEEQARVAVRTPPVGAGLRGAVEHRYAGRARRRREAGAVLDQVDGRRGFGERGQRRRLTHHAVLHLLQHERGVRRIDERGEVERHVPRRYRPTGEE